MSPKTTEIHLSAL